MVKKDILEKINKASRDKATSFDLSWNQLSSLPPEIGELTNLTELKIDDNVFKVKIPPIW